MLAHRTLTVLLALILSACTLSPPVEIDAELLKRWQIHQQQLNQLHRWELRASMVANSKDDGWSARIHWQQQGDAYQLRLHGPMGQGALRLSGDAQGVTLHTSDNSYHAATPEALLSQQANINLPLRYLLFWVRGLPVPKLDIQAQSFTPEGQLASLKQDDWEIQFARYTSVGKWLLPKKIRLENQHYLAKIGISQWLPNP